MKRTRFPLRVIGSLLVLGFLVAVLWMALERIEERTDAQSYETLAQSLRRAAVHCYAVEGRYPPDLDYLTSQYGISYDHSRYTVYYSAIGSNLMPDITVLPFGEEATP